MVLHKYSKNSTLQKAKVNIMAGLNDEADNLPVYGDDLDQATPLPSFVDQPGTNPEVKPSEQTVLVTRVGSVLDRLTPKEPPTAEQIFGDNIVLNELPNLNAKFVILKDEANRVSDINSFKNSITSKCAMCQEDARALDTITDGQFISPEKPIGYFTKDNSQTQYMETLKALNDLIVKKNTFLTEEYSTFINGLKTNIHQFTNEFNTVANAIDETVDRLKSININGPTFDEEHIHFLLDNEKSVNYFITANIDKIAITNYFRDDVICTAYDNLKTTLDKSELKKIFNLFTQRELTPELLAKNKIDAPVDNVSISFKDLLLALVAFNQIFTPFVRKTNTITMNIVHEIGTTFETLGNTDDEKVKFIESQDIKINLIQDYLATAHTVAKYDQFLIRNILIIAEHLNIRILAAQQ